MASADNGLPAGSRADSFSGGGGDAIEEVGPELGDLYQEALLLVSRLHPDMAAPLVDAVSHDSPLAGMLRRHGTESLRLDAGVLQAEGEALCALLPPADRDALIALVLASDAPLPSLLRLVAREQLQDGVRTLHRDGARLVESLSFELREPLLEPRLVESLSFELREPLLEVLSQSDAAHSLLLRTVLSQSDAPLPLLLRAVHQEQLAAMTLQRAIRCHQARKCKFAERLMLHLNGPNPATAGKGGGGGEEPVVRAASLGASAAGGG
ncbi:hypothetical protein T484DRAFT_1893811, partial [Baffinella frigidus]